MVRLEKDVKAKQDANTRQRELQMPATIDQNLLPNAIVEFGTAKDHGKSDAEAWAATVARIRHNVLHLAIATLSIRVPQMEEAEAEARNQCIRELIEAQGSYEGEPDQLAE